MSASTNLASNQKDFLTEKNSRQSFSDFFQFSAYIKKIFLCLINAEFPPLRHQPTIEKFKLIVVHIRISKRFSY